MTDLLRLCRRATEKKQPKGKVPNSGYTFHPPTYEVIYQRVASTRIRAHKKIIHFLSVATPRLHAQPP